MRIQLALNVKDLEAAVDFYSKMFGVEVNKRKPGYANFAIDEPPLKLVLFESPDASESLNHLGVEVFDNEDVAVAAERLKAEGMAELVEDETTCCYAKATKVWTTTPLASSIHGRLRLREPPRTVSRLARQKTTGPISVWATGPHSRPAPRTFRLTQL